MGERAGEVTGLIAAIRTNGAAAMFVTCAIDDVHNAKSALLTMPFKNYEQAAQEEIIVRRQLAASLPEDRTREEPHMDERSLQDNIAANPIASAAAFTFDTTLMTKHLIGVDPDRKKDHPIRERPKGIYGVMLQYIAVLETNLRDALHTHARASGGSTPQLLADLAELQELRETLLACPATHLEGDVARIPCAAGGAEGAAHREAPGRRRTDPRRPRGARPYGPSDHHQSALP
jgi:hypothetical protein